MICPAADMANTCYSASILYDPLLVLSSSTSQIAKLLDLYWANIDPLRIDIDPMQIQLSVLLALLPTQGLQSLACDPCATSFL